MVQSAAVSTAGVERVNPVQSSESQNRAPGGAASPPLSSAAQQLWQKLFQSSVSSTDNIALVLEQATQHACELVSSLGDKAGLDDLRQDIIANLQCLEKQIDTIGKGSADPAAKEFASQLNNVINTVKIEALLTRSVLDRYCTVERES